MARRGRLDACGELRCPKVYVNGYCAVGRVFWGWVVETAVVGFYGRVGEMLRMTKKR